MIAYLEGILMDAWNKDCILKTASGVGYEISLPAHVFSSLPQKGENCAFYISHVIREDAQELYGFTALEEKRIFESLLSISKVGARTALAILSVFRPEELRQLAATGDYQQLTLVPGIGQKTAQHIFLELKYKLAAMAPCGSGTAPAVNMPSVFGDTIAALVNLGYTEEECAPHVRDLLKAEPDLDVSEAIRAALKKLVKGKA